MTPAQLVALKSEIQNDPRGYGYAAFVANGSDEGVAQLLTWVRDGATACPLNGVAGPAISVKRTDISSQELLEAIDSRDFPATTDWRQSWFESATQQRTLRLVADDGSNTRVLGNLKRILGDTNLSQTRLTALSVRAGSRAEELFGTGTTLIASDVTASGIHG
jgi:hypothetical protein